jgi:hypothetical protein
MSIPLPSDFSSASSSSTSPLSISSKNPPHRFDAASFLHSNFYELAAVAAAHAAAQAAAFHNTTNNKSTVAQTNVNENSEQNPSSTTTTSNSYSTFQDFATSFTTQAAV